MRRGGGGGGEEEGGGGGPGLAGLDELLHIGEVYLRLPVDYSTVPVSLHLGGVKVQGS